jgi:hypothetical protein
MLLYHPFFDAHHCVFRMLQLLEKTGQVEVEVERFRLWDFYVLFPAALGEAQLPQGGSRGIRSLVRKLENRYEVLPDARHLFSRLEPMQTSALAHLSSIGIINAERLVEGAVLRTTLQIPEELSDLIRRRNAESSGILEFLTTTFLTLPLFGKGGVRVRTDLFDHRYDIP